MQDALNPFIETNIIPGLTTILTNLRQASALNLSLEQQRSYLKQAYDTLDQFLVSANAALLQIATLNEFLQQFRSWLKLEITNHNQQALQQDLRNGYLSLENIISQLVDSVDVQKTERHRSPTRIDLLQCLIEQRKAQSYLEIGCCGDACFSKITAPFKVGVDPISGGTMRMTSDAFFEANKQTFDLIFIDGLHESPQVDRDIANALRCSSAIGIIVMHDCDPKFEIRTLIPQISEVWNGDVWKSFVKVRSDHSLDCATGLFDHGTAVIIKRANSAPIAVVPESEMTWDGLVANRESWLRRMPYQELLNWIN